MVELQTCYNLLFTSENKLAKAFIEGKNTHTSTFRISFTIIFAPA